jgi:hypothetical protein
VTKEQWAQEWRGYHLQHLHHSLVIYFELWCETLHFHCEDLSHRHFHTPPLPLLVSAGTAVAVFAEGEAADIICITLHISFSNLVFLVEGF